MQFDRHDLTHWDDPHPAVRRQRRRSALRLALGLALVGAAVTAILIPAFVAVWDAWASADTSTFPIARETPVAP